MIIVGKNFPRGREVFGSIRRLEVVQAKPFLYDKTIN
jgi:hypothetical protein